MMVKVYKKTTNKDEKKYYNWRLNSEFVFSLEVSDVEKALDLLNNNNEGHMSDLNVQDGDFLVDESGVPHLVSENCTKVRSIGSKMFKVSYYGESQNEN